MTVSTSLDDGAVAGSLAGLAGLTRQQLLDAWGECAGEPPPLSLSTPVLRRALAHALQEKRLGGLSKIHARMLRNLCRDARGKAQAGRSSEKVKVGAGAGAKGVPPAVTNRQVTPKPRKPASRVILRPGTRLVREWQGRSHAVDVRADGFGWNGKVYRSLSAVATAITGVHWSGNRFFRV